MQHQQPHGVDVLADVLSATRIGGTVFCRSELTSPWGLLFEPDSRVGLHIVARGACWLRLRGRAEPVQLGQGDVVLLPHGSGHSLTSAPEVRPRPLAEVMGRCQVSQGPHGLSLSLEGEGASTVLLCGAYRFEHDGRHPLLSLLPPLIHLPAGRVPASLEAVLRLLVAEYAQPSPGSTTVTARLVDVLFVHIIRCWLEQQPEGNAGWLGAVRDAQVGRALALMHGAPHRDWTVEALASEVACSRATFMRRFRELVGEPPLAYLTHLRMELAARLLRESERPLADIAARVGYTSEFAFNRTFHRVRGVPPGRYREQMRQSLQATSVAPEAPSGTALRLLGTPRAAQGAGRARGRLGERGRAARSALR
jgi:AraC-like DNA-binding protein